MYLFDCCCCFLFCYLCLNSLQTQYAEPKRNCEFAACSDPEVGADAPLPLEAGGASLDSGGHPQRHVFIKKKKKEKSSVTPALLFICSVILRGTSTCVLSRKLTRANLALAQ